MFKRLMELYKKSKEDGLHLGEFHEAIELLEKYIEDNIIKAKKNDNTN